MRRNSTHDVLTGVPLFADLSRRDLRRVADVAVRVEVPAGHILAVEGTVGSELVVVIDGVLEVRRGDERVAELRAGDYFGEQSLLDRAPRNATVAAITSAVIDIIGREELEQLFRSAPAVEAQLQATAERRLERDRE
jgi:CRP-like cAMP-binding protein